MSSIPLYPDEKARLAALHSYQILDTLEEKDFDELTLLAAMICQVPIALISLVDDGRQWFKSHKGLPISQTPLDQSFCTHAIVAANDIMIVEDAHVDERFKANPLVTGEPYVSFYAGVPLINEDGFPLGTLCVVDLDKKKLTEEQQTALKVVARQVMDKLELRRRMLTLEDENKMLHLADKKNTELNTSLQFSNIRIKTFIEQAPVAIAIFRGDDLVVEAINPPMLQLLGKQTDILNEPLLKAIPELRDQPPFNMLYQVYRTGNPIYGHNMPVVLTRNGKQETGYYNFSYKPLIEDGKITGIIDIAVEVTNQLTAQKELQNAQDKMQLALDGAQLGLWSADMITGALTISDRARIIHGLPPDVSITMAEAIQMIPQEYRQKISDNIEQAILSKFSFEVEYPIIPLDGSPQRWLRSNGKAYYDDHRDPLYVTGTMLDITEQKQDEQRKNDFISMVSHELKTPLTSMTGYIQLLLARAKNRDDYFASEILEKVNKQTGKMTKMINGFLNVSRLESGKIYIDKQRFNMADLMKEIEEDAMPTMATHTVIFHPVEDTFVNADRDKIGQVVNNFLTNATKYAQTGTTIQVACITVDGCAQVSVQDEGMGINPQDVDKLFERYYRVEGNHMKTIAGFGIGLYLCAEIIQRHKGKIWVESKIGKGSIFYFSIPIVA